MTEQVPKELAEETSTAAVKSKKNMMIGAVAAFLSVIVVVVIVLAVDIDDCDLCVQYGLTKEEAKFFWNACESTSFLDQKSWQRFED